MQNPGQMTAAQQTANAQQQNLQARQILLANAYPMEQSIFSATFQPAQQTVFQVPPQNVGLIRGFLVRMTALITNPNAGSSVLTLTPFGPANLLQNVQFTDLQNYQRINTAGWHIAMLNSQRQGRPFLSSTPSDSPMGFGSNWPVIKAPTTIATNSSATIYMYYWIPLAYSDNDTTGAVYANVVNASMALQFTLATAAQAVVSSTSDPTLAIYQGAGAVAGVTLTNVTVQVYQFYYDQLPTMKGANGPVPILPTVDLNTIYELKNTAFTALVQGQDFNIGYSNFRYFLSTMAIFDNQLNGVYPSPGTDVNYWSLRSANTTDLRKTDPYTWQARNRKKILTDTPIPLYVFDTRDKPVYTTQIGNTNLVLNPSLVNAAASILVGWEMLANVTNLVQSGASLTSS